MSTSTPTIESLAALARQLPPADRARLIGEIAASLADTIYEAGSSYQSHLTRSLKHFIGRTPAEIPSTPIIT